MGEVRTDAPRFWEGAFVWTGPMGISMKTERATAAASRREFLRGGLRHALLAGLAATLAILVRNLASRLPGQTCVNQGICRGCGAFDDCGLPPALSAKQAMKGDDA